VRTFRAGLVLLTAIVLQAAVVSRLDIFGVHADILVLVPIAVALVDGPERGAMAGFVAGLAVDLLSTTPFGLTALAYSVVGFVVGTFQHGVLRNSVVLPIASAVLGSALGVLLWAVTATVVGVEGLLDEDLVAIVVVVSVTSGILVKPAVRIARWVDGGQPIEHGHRLRVGWR
jgi:rod shape-determining protein MreD